MGAPGFWDDQDLAARTSSDHSRATERLEGYNALNADLDELDGMIDLAREEEAGDSLEDDFLSELDDLAGRLDSQLAGLEEARLFSGEFDDGDAMVEINSGEGGTDAQDWAQMLVRMYERWAENRGLKIELLEAQAGTEAGLKSATLTISGENAYGLMSAERGVHRLVRLSPFDSANRRQTSFAAVMVSPYSENTEESDIELPDKDLRVDTYRASGAGGQHVNKTDSAVRITHLPTGIVVQCQNERSQTQNRATATSLLRSRLRLLEIEKREEEAAAERGETMKIGFGSQIRSYVIHPYTMVKDLRSDHEVGNAQGVLDGDIDGFIRAELERRAREKA